MEKLFKDLVNKSSSIVVTTHLHPDADGIGSQIALSIGLRSLGKNCFCVNEEPLLERYEYMDPDNHVMCFDEYIKQSENSEIDLFIVTDTNNLNRIGQRMGSLVHKAKNLLFIDHHPCPKELAAIHCIDTSTAATGELVGSLLESVDVKFTKEIALPLYTAILIDTSSFRYPSVSGETHRMVAKLLDAGVEPPTAYNSIYGTKKISYMQLLGRILASAQTTEDETIAWMTLNEGDLSEFNVDSEDTLGFINNLLILNKIKVACMFRQEGHNVKISFRSAGDVDVGIIAQALGGGGHNHSAATLIEGKLDDVVGRTIQKLKIMLSED
ncbi:MAG: DHH family phosphoesterase [Bacteriovoracaceae bacterium]